MCRGGRAPIYTLVPQVRGAIPAQSSFERIRDSKRSPRSVLSLVPTLPAVDHRLGGSKSLLGLPEPARDNGLIVSVELLPNQQDARAQTLKHQDRFEGALFHSLSVTYEDIEFASDLPPFVSRKVSQGLSHASP